MSVPIEPVLLPRGYGFRALAPAELRERPHGKDAFLDLCLIWEAPRRRGGHRYVIGVDVADGLGMDNSCIQVLRTGTLDEPAEQVAEYASSTIEPGPLAYTIQALGQYYRDADGVEAKVAVERTHHGLSTIDMLSLHLGYPNLYVWEYFDAVDPEKRFSTVYGWQTTPRTRPILVDKLRTALMSLDPVTSLPDLLTHSPGLHDELRDFQTAGALWEAEAAKGAHDDRIMALAIAWVVAWRQQAGESEPLEDRRRRMSEQKRALEQAAADAAAGVDYRNTPFTAVEVARHGLGPRDLRERDEDENDLLYDPRAYEDPVF